MNHIESTAVQQNGALYLAHTAQIHPIKGIELYEKFSQPNHNKVPLTDEHDEVNLSKLMASLPGKVYENCQRTARVIMLTQLEKVVAKSKKLKIQMTKQLEQFLPRKGDSEGSSEYTHKTRYFQSIHYSRVRIGQRSFIKNILLNPVFKQKFEAIFKAQNYENCEKARKNEHSQVSFEVRKKVINCVISEYQAKFRQEYYESKAQNEVNLKVEENSDRKMEEFKQTLQKEQQRTQVSPMPIYSHYQQNFQYLFYLPLMPIPLTPSQYECYQRRRMGTF